MPCQNDTFKKITTGPGRRAQHVFLFFALNAAHWKIECQGAHRTIYSFSRKALVREAIFRANQSGSLSATGTVEM